MYEQGIYVLQQLNDHAIEVESQWIEEARFTLTPSPSKLRLNLLVFVQAQDHVDIPDLVILGIPILAFNDVTLGHQPRVFSFSPCLMEI